VSRPHCRLPNAENIERLRAPPRAPLLLSLSAFFVE
jgi:hypothetical protein